MKNWDKKAAGMAYLWHTKIRHEFYQRLILELIDGGDFVFRRMVRINLRDLHTGMPHEFFDGMDIDRAIDKDAGKCMP